MHSFPHSKKVSEINRNFTIYLNASLIFFSFFAMQKKFILKLNKIKTIKVYYASVIFLRCSALFKAFS